jgi:hypothetical protein
MLLLLVPVLSEYVKYVFEQVALTNTHTCSWSLWEEYLLMTSTKGRKQHWLEGPP